MRHGKVLIIFYEDNRLRLNEVIRIVSGGSSMTIVIIIDLWVNMRMKTKI